MLPPLQYAALGFETFREEVLLPATIVARSPLQAAFWQPREPGTGSEVDRPGRGTRFQPVDLGHRWGPVWSTGWFRITGVVSRGMRGLPVSLRFSSGTEGTLWRGREPIHGFDPYRDRARLYDRARGSERVDVLVEAACNLPLGISTFWWDHAEQHARWKERTPGRLESCELVSVDEGLLRFAREWDYLRRALLALAPDSPRAIEIMQGLRAIQRRVDGSDPRPGMRAVTPELIELRRGRAGRATMTCVAVGHAHIDTAWLWPIRETRRKCVRTFSNVLALMDRFPRFRFLCSQAQQYAYVEEDAPGLFAALRERVREGRWEPGGGMWIEPDATCPSGESFIRQILHGERYWRERFGRTAPQSFLYLPDTFGFPPCLPQIARGAGLDTFITNKMSWCESNRFPHVTFRWIGLDGTELLTHLTPGHNYNAPLEPHDLVHAERTLAGLDGHSFVSAAIPRWLQPFGYGDGGGGPTEDQVARVEIGQECEGLPRIESTRVDDFCRSLHRARTALQERGEDIASWDGELYLELHRGTYTSQAWIKRQNRIAEDLLREVEILASSAPGADDASRDDARARLEPLWKLVLLNQFHDILPGSSIGEVYADARRDHVRVAEEAGALRDELVTVLAASAPVQEFKRPVLVRNLASTERGGVVEVDGTLVMVAPIPPLGHVVVEGRAPTAPAREESVVVERVRSGIRLSNACLEATIDREGRVADLRQRGADRSANALVPGSGRLRARPMNQLVLFEDRPRRWEAWDIDRDYAAKRELVESRAEVTIALQQPLRGAVRVARTLGRRSTIFQTYSLDAGARRLDIHTEINWQEERRMLRAVFPCAVRAVRATFGTQFGCVERPTHRNTSWDEARFEVPGHAWMDLSEPGMGVAVLDDGKYGRSALGDELGLTLLRAPNFPDPDCDRGEHAFTYAIMPHQGSWREAGVDQEAEALRMPLRTTKVLPTRRPRQAKKPPLPAPFTVIAPRHCTPQIAAWKPAEDGRGRILRLVEVRGGRGDATLRWHERVRSVTPVDLLERPLPRSPIGDSQGAQHDRRTLQTTVALRPFGIVTLRVIDA